MLKEFNASGLNSTADITPQLISRWIKGFPRRKPRTAYSLLRSFRSVTTYCKAAGWIERDPFDSRKPASWYDLVSPEEGDRMASRSASHRRRNQSALSPGGQRSLGRGMEGVPTSSARLYLRLPWLAS